MSLSGYAKGISEGLRNAALFQNIKSTMASQEAAERREARDVKLFERGEQEYQQSTKLIDLKEWASKSGEPDFAIDYVSTAYPVENGKIQQRHAMAAARDLNTNPELVKKGALIKLQRLEKEISDLESQAPMGALADSFHSTAIANKRAEHEKLKYGVDSIVKQEQAKAAERREQRQRQKDIETAKRQEEELRLRGKEVDIKEKEAEKGKLPTNILQMRHNVSQMPDGPEKEAARKALKEQEDFELQKAKRDAKNDPVARQIRAAIIQGRMLDAREDLKAVKKEHDDKVNELKDLLEYTNDPKEKDFIRAQIQAAGTGYEKRRKEINNELLSLVKEGAPEGPKTEPPKTEVPKATVKIGGKEYTKILRDKNTGAEYGVLPDGKRELLKKGGAGRSF